MACRVVDTGKASAAENMAKDVQLLHDLSGNDLTLHFYDWESDSATYGYFVDPSMFLDSDKIRRHQLQLAKRPTGGGIIFHICDFAFSVLIPAAHPGFSVNTLDNYAFVNGMVAQAIQRFSSNTLSTQLLQTEAGPLDPSCRCFCMAKPTIYDLMISGRKVGGAAQRRVKQGLLHQGTLCLGMLPEEYLEDLLLPGTRLIEAMRQNSFSLLGSEYTPYQLSEAKNELRYQLTEAMSNCDDNYIKKC